VLGSLPKMQRAAAERYLLRDGGDHATDDQRAVVAAFTGIVNRLAESSPVLVAIDDVQWLDAASRHLLAFAGRRLRGRVAMLLTELTSSDGAASWLTLDSPDRLQRTRVSPMDAARLQRLIVDRLGRSFSRPAMLRIARISGGNPLYALELARAVGNPAERATSTLPPALAERVMQRVGHFDDDVERALLAAACVSDPTVDLMAATTSTTVDRLVELLEVPETQGVVTIDGNRVRFTHPILAHGIYTQASPATRRQIHRALADLEATPEQRARHRGLAATSADRETLRALDAAAASLGATDPIAAAELIEMAMGLGGDTPMRRIIAARHHLAAGDLDRGRALAESAVADLPAGAQRGLARLLIGGMHMCRGDFDDATRALRLALGDAAEQPGLQVGIHLVLAMAQSSLGDSEVAQRHSLQATTGAEQLKDSHLISQALTLHVLLQCRRGLGLDRLTLDRALALEDPDAYTAAPYSARTVDALAAGWMGRHLESESKITAILRHYVERGTESELPWIQFHASMVDIWLGHYDKAARTAEDMSLRAEQVGGTHLAILAAVPAALSAAYAGLEEDARKAIERATVNSAVPEGRWTMPWPAMALGFLEVSLGNYTEALNALQPLLIGWHTAVDTDIATHYFVPDAVEAMIALDTLDHAEELVATLERNGERLNHPWLTAIGGRCRSMLLAARGDLDGAERAALQAMSEHDRIAVPFERARTQLVLGQLQRRMRRKQAARTTLEAALSTFVELGTSLWAARADEEISRLSRGQESELTATEQRVAELAASGMTNKDVAAALFISPKTVESNLGRVYRKLGIRSRVELSRRLGDETSGDD
jgi:DNA-binding CsgD family transcriptional regulator